MKRRFLAFSFYLFCQSTVDLQSCVNFCCSRIFYFLFSHFQQPLYQLPRGKNNTKIYPIALATFGVSNYMIFFIKQIKQEDNLEAILTNLLIKTKLVCLFQCYYIYGPALTTICDHWGTVVLTLWTFVGRVISLLFNTLSSFVIAFLPRNSCLLI